MSWVRTGTAAFTNGSANVVGTSTGWVALVRAGDALHAPDGRVYEIASVNSDVGITMASNYQGSTASGQAYAIQPTQDYQRALAVAAAQLVNDYSTVKNNAGAGAFGGGTVSQPGVRATTDTDTGVEWPGSNVLGLVAGGRRQVRVTAPNAGADREVILSGGNSAGGTRAGIGATEGDLQIGNCYLTGSVKIGAGFEWSTGHYLYTSSADTVTLRLRNDGGTAYATFGVASSVPYLGGAGGVIALYAGTAERLRVATGGAKITGPTEIVNLGTTDSATVSIHQANSDTTSRPALNLTKNGAVQLQISADGAGGGNCYYDAIGGSSRHQWSTGGSARWAMNASAFFPSVDNTYTVGGASNRPSVLYAASGTINTSDRHAKCDIEPLTLGLSFLRQIPAVTHRWIIGRNEVEVIDSDDLEAFTEPVIEPVTVLYEEVQVIDGKPVMVRGTRTEQRVVVDMLPVLDEAGQPVMVDQPQPPLVSEVEIEGRIVRVETPRPALKVPMTHAVERTHVVRRPKRVQVVTPRPGSRRHAAFLAQDVKAALDAAGVDLGMWTLDDAADPESRQGLRYEQFIPVLVRALVELDDARKALADRVATLEAIS